MPRVIVILALLCFCSIVTSRDTSSESEDDRRHRRRGHHQKHKHHKRHKQHKKRAEDDAAPAEPALRLREPAKPMPLKEPGNLLRIRDELFNPYKHQGSNEIMTALLIGNVTQHTLNTPYVGVVMVHGRRWCGCSLVDLDWALTAAHCLNYVLPVSSIRSLGDYVQARFGSIHTYRDGELVPVDAAVRHPKFEEEPAPHADVALLKLARKLVLTPLINLIKLYDGVQEPYAQSSVAMTGWGAGRADFGYTDPVPDLSTVRLKVRDRRFCRDAFQTVNGFEFSEDFFCASFRHGERDVCRFDAGIAAVQQNMLMGILSFGPERCGMHYEPAVFVKTFFFRDFVKKTLLEDKTPAEVREAMALLDQPFPPLPTPAVHLEVTEGSPEVLHDYE